MIFYNYFFIILFFLGFVRIIGGGCSYGITGNKLKEILILIKFAYSLLLFCYVR
jgi:hypothetical protein